MTYTIEKSGEHEEEASERRSRPTRDHSQVPVNKERRIWFLTNTVFFFCRNYNQGIFTINVWKSASLDAHFVVWKESKIYTLERRGK